jgi:cytidylate kinase
MTDQEMNQEQLPVAARERMERWLTSEGLCRHLEKALDTGRRPARTGPYIAISREAGSGGLPIARAVAEQLGWDVLDKEILDFMAKRYGVPRGMLEFVDETRANWVHDVLSSWFDTKVVSHEKFVVYLERIVFLAAMYGHVVFVGRGAQCILPRASGLAVRLVAPLEWRIQRRMSRHQISRNQARKEIEEIETGRREFYRRYFQHDCSAASDFDLVLNVSRFSPSTIAQQIVEAYERIELDIAPNANVHV